MTDQLLDWNDVARIPLPTLAGGSAFMRGSGGGLSGDGAAASSATYSSSRSYSNAGGLGMATSPMPSRTFYTNSSDYERTTTPIANFDSNGNGNFQNSTSLSADTNVGGSTLTAPSLLPWNRGLSGLQAASQNLLEQASTAAVPVPRGTAAVPLLSGAGSRISNNSNTATMPATLRGNVIGSEFSRATTSSLNRPHSMETFGYPPVVHPSSMTMNTNSAVRSDERQQDNNGYYYNHPVTNTAMATSSTNRSGGTGGDLMVNNYSTASTTKNSLDIVLARHEKDIIDRILSMTNQQIHQQTEEQIEQQLQKNWDQERDLWANHNLIGNRTLGGASATMPMSRDGAALYRRGNTSQVNIRHTESGVPAHAIVPFDQSITKTWTSQPTTTQHMNVNFAKAHLALLERMKTDLNAVVEELLQLCHQHTSTSSSSSISSARPLKGYKAAWTLVSRLIDTSSSSPTPIEQGRAALAHLCSQFYEMIVMRNRQVAAALSSRIEQLHNVDYIRDNGRRGVQYHSEIANQCQIFVQDTIGTNSDHKISNKDEAVPIIGNWPVIYYCLRAGDAIAALEVMQHPQQQHSSGAGILQDGNISAVHRILSGMAQTQQNQQRQHQSDRLFPYTLWDFDGASSVNESDRQLVRNMIDSSVRYDPPTLDSITATNIHQMGVYALLSGVQLPQSESVPGFNTIEDYLAGMLWQALNDPKNPVEGLVRIGDTIESFGPGYFNEDDESSGWAFASPLLICQHYEHALLHLANTGATMGLLQATHLSLVLIHAGYEIRDLGRPLVNSPRAREQLAATTTLLVSYANRLLVEPSLGPVAALNYLVRIPNKAELRKEVAQLIASTKEIEQLAGVINAEGLRPKDSILDRLLSPQDVSSILAEASEILLVDKGDLPKSAAAAMCLMLAERYSDVLMLLNEFLAPPNRPDPNRTFWIQQTESFHSHYLSKRTRIYDLLEGEGRTSLIGTNRMMLQLNQFFALYQARQYDEAWVIADALNLIPLTSNDLPIKESLFLGMDTLIRQAIPALLLSIMEMMYHEHAQLKRDSVIEQQSQGGFFGGSVLLPNTLIPSGATAVARERRRQLQERAKLCVTMSGLVGMINEDIDNLSRLQSLMV